MIQIIDWHPIAYAMRKLTFLYQIRIHKMIHEWTPTRVSPGNDLTAIEDWLCPMCHRAVETPEHFIRCEHVTQTLLKTKLKSALTDLCTKNRVDPHLYQLWWIGLNHPDPTDPTPDTHDISMYPEPYHPIFWQQTKIGWKQLYYGHLSTEWTIYLSWTHPQLNSTKLLASMIATVWTTLLELWKSRNFNNNEATTQFPPQMLSRTNGIYASQSCLPHHAKKEFLPYIRKNFYPNWKFTSKIGSKTVPSTSKMN